MKNWMNRGYYHSVIVIDKMLIDENCVVYQSQIMIGDGEEQVKRLIEWVEEFFEDASIEVDVEVVETIASDLAKKGHSTWKNYHFEVLAS